MIDENSTKFEDLLELECLEGIYEGSIHEDGDNWKYHAEWFFDELEYFAEKYNIKYKNDISDKNIRKFRNDIRDYLLGCLTVVDVEELGYGIAIDLESDIVDESDIDWRCSNDWCDEQGDIFEYAYNYLKSFGCKIRSYNGKIE